MFKVGRGGGEEIPVVQGKEQWLCFAGAAVKRYLTSKVREPGMLGYESRQVGSGQTGDGKNEHRHARNQQTKMDWNGCI